MNYQGPGGSLPSAYDTPNQLPDISVQSNKEFDYSHHGGEALYVPLSESMGSPAFDPSQLETSDAPSANVAGNWDYVPRDSKNLDSVVDELGPDEVRWFYKNEADKRWLEFTGYDSLRIEFKYRQLYQEWHFYVSENSWPPNERKDLDASTSSALNFNSVAEDSSSQRNQNPSANASNVEHKIVVRGGMYEVDLHEWKCLSIYWPGDECAITRGNWFYGGTWQPLEVEQSNKMEMFHLEKFYGHKLSEYYYEPASKVTKAVLFSLSFPEFQVKWYSPTEVHLYSEATPSKLVRTFTQKLGFQSKGYRLYRGYKELATLTDRPVDITHLVFVIHGIGQKMETGRIIRNTSRFRDCVTWLEQKYFSQSLGHQRAEFFPVEWRSSLNLNDDMVESVTPHKLLGLRQILNASAMDIMYYTSPLYGNEVQQGLMAELNRLYVMFTNRNPYFNVKGGKVSVLAHSLGCVIVYDIITGWRSDSWQMLLSPGPTGFPFSSPEPSTLSSLSIASDQVQSQNQDVAHERENSETLLPSQTPQEPKVKQQDRSPEKKPVPSTPAGSQLLFQVENLFFLGSPLAVFLAMRWRNTEMNILPPSLCQRFYNVFHPSDPIAYRMEPLIVRDYCRIAPILIQAYNVEVHPNYDSLPMEPLIVETTNTGSTTAMPGTPKKEPEVDIDTLTPPGGTPSKDRAWSIWGLMKGSWKAQDGASSPQFDSLSGGLQNRLDFVLRDPNLGGSYLSALTSHTAYWNNYDVAYFVLTRLFPELAETEITSETSELEPL